MDKIVVAVLIGICVVTGIWGWWMENGPEQKDKTDDGNKMNGDDADGKKAKSEKAKNDMKSGGSIAEGEEKNYGEG